VNNAGGTERGPTVSPPAVDPLIAAVSDDALPGLVASLRHLIDRRIDGIHYAESRRGQLAIVGGAIAAGGVAVLPLAANSSTALRYAYEAGGAVAILVGLVTWFQYALQTNPKYRFLPASKTRKWFYHQALPNEKELKKRKSEDNYTQEYNKQFDEFREAQVPIFADQRLDATEDLRQLFLLHVNELWKNVHLSQLRKTLRVGVIVVVVAAAAAFFIGLIHGDDEQQTKSGSTNTAGYSVAARWQPTGATRTLNGALEEQLVTSITIDNHDTRRPLPVGAIVAIGRDGVPVPTDVLTTLPSSVPSKTDVRRSVLVWIPQALADDVVRFDVR
jgi:hypothetical protein